MVLKSGKSVGCEGWKLSSHCKHRWPGIGRVQISWSEIYQVLRGKSCTIGSVRWAGSLLPVPGNYHGMAQALNAGLHSTTPDAGFKPHLHLIFPGSRKWGFVSIPPTGANNNQ